MNNFIAKGETQTLTAPYAVASGGGALIGSIFGVAKVAIAIGARGPFLLEGKVDLPKDANAIGEGAKVYWDNAAKVVTANAAAGANVLIGACTAARGAGDARAHVRLNGTVA